MFNNAAKNVDVKQSDGDVSMSLKSGESVEVTIWIWFNFVLFGRWKPRGSVLIEINEFDFLCRLPQKIIPLAI